jgi:RNA polymerase sigma-70 factor (ECF subfamily)
MTAPEVDELDVRDMRLLAQGHDVALNDLMERHAGRLFQYLVRCLQNEDDASDLAQETFARVYANRLAYDSRHRFSTWLYTIASNLVKDHYRWRSRHREVAAETSPDGETSGPLVTFPSPEHSPDETLQATERAAAVRRAVAELPEELRQPLLLSEYQELSHAEIAAILGCTPKAVETRLYRARQQLRSRLARWLQAA